MNHTRSYSSRRSSRARIFSAAMLAAPAMAAVMMLGSQARAASLYWDTNGASGGASSGTTADGTWDAATPNWSTDATGASATSAWTGGSTAVFSAGSNATGTSNVTVSGTQQADGITFEDGTVNLNGGEVDLTGTGTLNTVSSSNSSINTINSVIGGSVGLTRTAGSSGNIVTPPASTSNLVLNGTNTYTGITQINSGVLTLTNGSALGAAGTIGSGNEVVFGTTANAADPGADALSLSRIDLSGGITVAGEGVVIRSGGGFDAPGQLSSASGINTWTGDVRIDGGANNAAGDGLAGIGAAAGATLILDGGTISNNPGLVAGTNSGDVGVWWAKTGAGTVILRNVTNNTIGTVRVLNGTLVAESDGVFGATATDPSDITQCVIINNGGTGNASVGFEAPPLSSGFTYTGNREIYTAGTFGFNNQGEIVNLGGNNTFEGGVVLSIGAGVGVQAGSLDLAGPLYAAGLAPRQETKLGPGELIISSTNTGADGPGSGGIPQHGIVSGTFTIQQGQLTFRNNPGTGGTGSLSGGIGFVVDPGATLSLDNSLGVNSSRIGATAPITLSSSELKLVGNATQSVIQTAGNVQGFGESRVTVSQPASINGSTTTLDLSTATFSTGGSLLLRGIDATTGFINLSGTLLGGGGVAGTTNISILPQAVGDASSTGSGTDFVTIDSGHARVLTPAEYTPLVSGANSLDNTTALTPGTLALSANTAVNSLKINGGTSISIAAGDSLSLNSGALLGVGSGTSTVSGGTLNFTNQGYVTVPTGSSLNIASTIGSASPGLVKSGAGTLTLSADNSAFAGVTYINNGVVSISADNNIGSATAHVNINGGTLGVTGTFSSIRGITLVSPIFNGVDVSAGNTLTLSGTIDGTGGLFKTGDGNLVLTGNNTYVGATGDGTTIQAGTLTITSDANVNGTNLDPTASFYNNEIALSGGTLHLTASGLYRTPVAINSNTGGFLIDPGTVVTFGDPTDIASDGRFVGSGTLILDGGGTLNPVANNLETGDNIIKGGSSLEYTLAQGVSNLSAFHPAHFLLDNGRLLTIGQDPNAIPGGVTTYSARRGITLGAGGGTLEAQVGTSPAPYLLTFPQPIAGSGPLTITTDAQSIINLAGAFTNTGTTTITSGSTVQVTGSGALGGGLVTNNGTLQAQSTFSMPGGITGTGTTTVGDGTNPATVSAAFYQLPNLTVSAGATARVLPSGGANSSTSRIGTLTLAPTAQLDVTDNKVILPGATLGTFSSGAYTGVTGLVASGRNGGAWNGPGIITSSTTGNLTTLGVATADQIGKVGQSWGGQTLGTGDVLVMYTYGGDANLDGKINIDDYGRIDGNVGQSGSVFGWYNGDFNYDGKINIDDYGIIDGNIGIQGSPIPTVGQSLAGFADSGVTAVPEPASFSLVILGAMGMLGIRRRRSENNYEKGI